MLKLRVWPASSFTPSLCADLDHPVGFVERDRHRLLDDDVLAGAHRLDRVLAVEAVGRRDPDGFDVRIARRARRPSRSAFVPG